MPTVKSPIQLNSSVDHVVKNGPFSSSFVIKSSVYKGQNGFECVKKFVVLIKRTSVIKTQWNMKNNIGHQEHLSISDVP